MTINIDHQPIRGGCPIDHTAFSKQKTATRAPQATPAIERVNKGTWHVRGYAEGRAVLRHADTHQAGFRAELLDKMPQTMERPILYQEGPKHHEQRRQTARFFTPRFTSENYRALMENLSDQVIARLHSQGQADLSMLSLALAVNVAARVIGLTNSVMPGMARRIDAFFTESKPTRPRSPGAVLHFLRSQRRMMAFFLLDVRPAIAARRREPREDLISHLISRGYSDMNILTECITYGAAGMVTTREFISVAAWHFLEQPRLRQQFLAANEAERQNMLQEILRIEPVIGQVLRRATADLLIESEHGVVTIPAGDLVIVDVYDTNSDPALVGAEPQAICPARKLSDPKAGPAVLSFGDGHHRCPGAYVALQESDIFLSRLLAIDSLRIVRSPTMAHNSVARGYELRDFVVAV